MSFYRRATVEPRLFSSRFGIKLMTIKCSSHFQMLWLKCQSPTISPPRMRIDDTSFYKSWIPLKCGCVNAPKGHEKDRQHITLARISVRDVGHPCGHGYKLKCDSLTLAQNQKPSAHLRSILQHGSDHPCVQITAPPLRMHASFPVFICVGYICLWVFSEDSEELSFASEPIPVRYGGSSSGGTGGAVQRLTGSADRWRGTWRGRGVHLHGLLLRALPAAEWAEKGGAVLRRDAGF